MYIPGKKEKYNFIYTMVLAILVFMVGCSGGGVSATSEKVAEKLEIAVKYLTENKFEEAILTYQEVIKIDNLAVKAYQGLGKVYVLQGKFEDAQKIYQQGAEALKDKAFLQLRLSLAGMYIDKGDLKAAEQIYKEIISQNPTCIEAYQGLALAYQQQGDKQKARAVLEDAVQMNNSDSRAYNALAGYYIENNQKDKAWGLLVYSLSLDINQTEAYIALKDLYSENWEELIQESTGINDQNIASMLEFYALYESGKYQEAFTVYERQLKQNPNNQKARVLAGIAAFHAGDKTKALELIKGLRTDHQNEWVMADIARYFMLTGEKEKAIEWAKKSFEVGENIEAVKILYEIYSKDNSALAKIYVAKLVLYSWLPLSTIEQELYANSIEMPFQLSGNQFIKKEAKDIVKKILFEDEHVKKTSFAWKNIAYYDTKNNIAYQCFAFGLNGEFDFRAFAKIPFTTNKGVVYWEVTKNQLGKFTIFRIHNPKIYTADYVRTKLIPGDPSYNEISEFDEWISNNTIYRDNGQKVPNYIPVIKGNLPFEKYLEETGISTDSFVFADIN